MMDFLHRGVPSIKQEVSSGLVRKKIDFSQGVAASREEWFIRGTEPNLRNQGTGEFNPRILYPPSGTVLAVDPDIPPELQKVFFVSQIREDHCQWLLNGSALKMTGRTIPWIPKAGKYHLAIADKDEKVLDYVYFEVRGSGAD
jgi:penicillin-binding protein 1C